MTKVRCEKCGNVQRTYAKWFFVCSQCNLKQLVENMKIDDEEEKINISQNQNPLKDVETKKEVEQNIGIAPQKNIFEIEEDEKENEKENIFYCPNCKQKVEEFRDCLNCGTEIIWSEE